MRVRPAITHLPVRIPPGVYRIRRSCGDYAAIIPWLTHYVNPTGLAPASDHDSSQVIVGSPQADDSRVVSENEKSAP